MLIIQAITANVWNPGRKYPKKNIYQIIGDNVVVQLTQGKYCIIDMDNISILDSYTWCYNKANGTAMSGNITIHKYIMEQLHPDRLSHIVHISGDKLDNRESNLSFVQRSDRLRKDNTSGVTGVYFHPKKGKWIAEIMRDGDRLYSSFHSIEKAIEWRLNIQNYVNVNL